MFKKVSYIFILSYVCLVINSCKKENAFDCFKPTGKIINQLRNVSGFRDIEVSEKIDIYLSQGAYYEVKVEAGKNLQTNIITEVKDSVLIIKNINTCNFVRSPKKPINIYITSPRYKFLKNNGVGAIKCNTVIKSDTILTLCTNSGDIHLNLDVEEIRSSSHGNGDLYLNGKTKKSFHYLKGTNYIYAADFLISNYTFIDMHSIGHCYIKAPENGTLEASIWSRGNIYYTGNPQQTLIKKYNTGDLIKNE